ncbi:hypothetical protein J729_4705, partial [Acinetobacter baumannii 929679-598]
MFFSRPLIKKAAKNDSFFLCWVYKAPLPNTIPSRRGS